VLRKYQESAKNCVTRHFMICTHQKRQLRWSNRGKWDWMLLPACQNWNLIFQSRQSLKSLRYPTTGVCHMNSNTVCE
jgi:hypothetical protein